LTPTNDIAYPTGATHVSLSSAFLKLDFDTNDNAIEYSPIINLPINSTFASQALTPAGVPSGKGNDIFVLLVSFFKILMECNILLKMGHTTDQSQKLCIN
jgi:hypothetical protein